MQTAVRYESKPRRHRRNEMMQLQEELALNELATLITRNVVKRTYDGVQALKIDTEPDRVTLSGICESYYIKQLAQQAVMGMVADEEIVNDIAVM